MEEQHYENSLQEQEDQNAEDAIFRSFRLSRILIPIGLGLGAVLYMLWQKFNPEDFAKIQWTGRAWVWISIGLLLLVARHLCYALRLYFLADGSFSYRKCIELIFIWEFSTAVAPTSAGGAAIALFVLTLEKISPARTAVIVIYKVLLDSIFYFTLFPILFLIFGWRMMRPDVVSWATLDNSAYVFLTVFCLMTLQGALLLYGLFLNPGGLKKLLDWVTRLRFMKRFRAKALKFGDEVVAASSIMKSKPWRFHLRAFGATAAAWICRFLLINCLIIGLVENIPTDLWTQFNLFSRLATMYVVTLFAPTPGGSGVAEAVFGSFLSDYIPATTALIVAFIWRLMTYYSYLIAGAVVIPNWIRRLIEARKLRRQQQGEIE